MVEVMDDNEGNDAPCVRGGADRPTAARGGDKRVVDYDDFQRDVLQRKRERWAKILAGEPPGPVPNRRPRDPEKERLLLKLDRARLAREARARRD